jgi:hypothetical protein
MASESMDSTEDILEFPIPPDIHYGDIIPFGERVFDSAAISLNFVFMLLWMIVCFVIWIGIGVPIFIVFWLIANIFDILSKPFRSKQA